MEEVLIRGKAADQKNKKGKKERQAVATKEAENIKKGRKIGNLIWSGRSSNKMNWDSAKQYCANLSEGGFTDWRLPNIDELRTTIKHCPKTRAGGECKVSEKNGRLSYEDGQPDSSCCCDDRAYNGGYYSKLGDDYDVVLWSSSTLAGNTKHVWGVLFYSGFVGNSRKSNSFNVRCVRSLL